MNRGKWGWVKLAHQSRAVTDLFRGGRCPWQRILGCLHRLLPAVRCVTAMINDDATSPRRRWDLVSGDAAVRVASRRTAGTVARRLKNCSSPTRAVVTSNAGDRTDLASALVRLPLTGGSVPPSSDEPEFAKATEGPSVSDLSSPPWRSSLHWAAVRLDNGVNRRLSDHGSVGWR